MKVTSKGNLAIFIGEKESLYVEILSRNLLRFSTQEIKGSRIANLNGLSPVVFSCHETGEGYELSFASYSLLVTPSLNFKILKNNNILLESADELENVKVEDDIYPRARSFLIHDDEHFYGLGDHPGPLDRRGYCFVNWNSDVPAAHEETMKSLYKSFPLYYGLREAGAYGIYLDSSEKTFFDFGVNSQEVTFGVLTGNDPFYLALGEDLKEVIGIFSKILGTYPLPPLWALGYGQCRWSYASEKEAEEVLLNYKKASIPLTTLYLDIDYMDGYRIFTSDNNRFPHFKEWISSLHTRGYKLITILDPGVKVDKNYSIYQEGIDKGHFATIGQKVYENEVWPGLSVYPSFNEEKTRTWWGDKISFLTDLGVDGIWDDMNEPASFKGPLPLDVKFGKEPHSSIHNLYGYYMSQATFEGLKKQRPNARPFVITRACFAGIERFSSVWTGDNQSLWSHLVMALPQQMNIGLSLEPFVGTDIGGFGGDCPEELMCRWIEVGAFSPLMRNHSAMGTKHQEPYRYSISVQAIYRKWVQFRYSLLPYLYDAFYFHQSTGLPIIRPLALESSIDKGLLTDGSEFMFGDNLLVAPITQSGVSARAVAFPSSCRFYDYFNMENSYAGGSLAAVSLPLDSCGVYAKAGSIIPLNPDGYYDASKPSPILLLRLFPGQGKYIHYQDAGDGYGYLKGEYNLYEFTNNNGTISIKILHQGYKLYEEIKAISSSGVTSIRL
jgi:alpha-glucosidase